VVKGIIRTASLALFVGVDGGGVSELISETKANQIASHLSYKNISVARIIANDR